MVNSKSFSLPIGLLILLLSSSLSTAHNHPSPPTNTCPPCPCPCSENTTPPPSSPNKSSPPSPQSDTSPPSPQSNTSPPSPQSDNSPPSPHSNTSPPSPQSNTSPPSPQGNTSPPSPDSNTSPPSPQGNTSPPSPNSNTSPPSPQSNSSPPSPDSNTSPPSPQSNTSPPSPKSNTSPPSPPNNISPSSPPTNSYKGCFKKIYAFGDSYTDTGNAICMGSLGSFANVFLSHNFYGSTTFKKPMNRLCDGRLVLDFLSEALGLPYVPPYHDTAANFSCGANFAVAGSTSLSSDFFLRNKVGHTLMWNRVPHSFLSQIDWFNKFIQEVDCKGKDESACKAEMANSLFWIGEMGVNDYTRTFGSSFSTQLLMETTVNNVCRLLKAMLLKGAKYIVVQGLPPTGCLPLDLSTCSSSDRDDAGCSASANAVIKAHNDLLQSKLAKLQEQFSGCSIIYADYWSAYRTILMKSKEYHFEEPYKACCGAGDSKLNFDANSICGSPSTSKCAEPRKYINWDGVHLTEAMHEKLADLFFNQGFCRPSFDKMISAKLSA